jgi:hypothetical protein
VQFEAHDTPSSGLISRNPFVCGGEPSLPDRSQQCCRLHLSAGPFKLSEGRAANKGLLTVLCPIEDCLRAAWNSAVAPSRRDDPQRLLQAIYGVRNGAAIGIGYHVPGIIYEMQM